MGKRLKLYKWAFKGILFSQSFIYFYYYIFYRHQINESSIFLDDLLPHFSIQKLVLIEIIIMIFFLKIHNYDIIIIIKKGHRLMKKGQTI
jgi:hypothetical protein